MSKTTPTSGISRQPIVFFGTEDFSLYSLRALVEAGFNIVAVITKPDSRRGRSNKLIQPAVKQFASQHHIPVWQPKRLKNIISDIKNITPQPTGVLVSYGKISRKQSSTYSSLVSSTFIRRCCQNTAAHRPSNQLSLTEIKSLV